VLLLLHHRQHTDSQTLYLKRKVKQHTKMSAQISKRRKFVADGVFQAELGEFL
jgi:hypothetical protein